MQSVNLEKSSFDHEDQGEKRTGQLGRFAFTSHSFTRPLPKGMERKPQKQISRPLLFFLACVGFLGL